MAMQNSQNHHRIVSEKVKYTVLENRQVHAPDVGKANGIQGGISRKIIKTFVSFGKKTVIQTGLLATIPFSTVNQISLNERMKDERQHFGGRG